MLVLTQDDALARELERTIATVPALSQQSLSVDALIGDVHQALANLREREPARVLGFVARDEPSVIEALEAGADEASVLDPTSTAAVVAFVDRALLRARQRMQTRQLQAALRHTEKLAALGTLVAGVGHEINNPLSAVMLSISAAQRYIVPVLEASAALAQTFAATPEEERTELAERLLRLSPARAHRDALSVLEDVNAAAGSIASIVRDLRVFARADEQEAPELVHVPDLIDHVLRLLGRDVSNHGVITRDYAANVPALVIPRSRLTQVLTNLLVNASQAIAEVERSTHRVDISVRTDDEFLAIAIRDTGPGIAPNAISRIFDPFYTTKRKELGTGLGLSISRAIVRQLGGDLTVESVFGEGATFLCFLPLPTREAEAQARASVTPMVGKPEMVESRTVMVIDDDPRMLRAYGRLLNPDHRVLVAHDASEAIELLESGSTPDAIVLEIDLPAREGVRLLGWITQHRPALLPHTVIVTARDAEARHAQALNAHPGPVLFKPMRGEALLATLATLKPGTD